MNFEAIVIHFGENFLIGRFIDLFVVSTHNITEVEQPSVTYHHSRLMGSADILNTVIHHFQLESLDNRIINLNRKSNLG